MKQKLTPNENVKVKQKWKVKLKVDQKKWKGNFEGLKDEPEDVKFPETW